MLLMPSILMTVITSVFVLVNFLFYLKDGKIKTNASFFKGIKVWTVLILPILFIVIADYGKDNECCSDSAVFSPEHRIGIYIIIVVTLIAYAIAIYRKQLFTPILELLLNVFLVLGLVLNSVLCIHLTTVEEGYIWWIFGNIPIILLLLMQLHTNHLLLQHYIVENQMSSNGFFGKVSFYMLHLDPLVKYPLLLILIIPILVLLTALLMVFGQKPDSIISAFTDTYKHGFSQLDYMCDNVDCGGHYLCSVGANGHQNVVKPIRLGERNGGTIICNRQLLISNAFEDVIQERWPKLHKFVRHQYNRVGDVVHKYYGIFNIKWVSDVVYILMKPLEWLFLITLYVLDKKPENRIAVQYLKQEDRIKIKNRLKECQ